MLERRTLFLTRRRSVIQTKALLFAKLKRTAPMQGKYCPFIFPIFIRDKFIHKTYFPCNFKLRPVPKGVWGCHYPYPAKNPVGKSTNFSTFVGQFEFFYRREVGR